MSGYFGGDSPDSPLSNRGNNNVSKKSFLESLSDDELLTYIEGLSQGDKRQEYSRGDYFEDKERKQDEQDKEFRKRFGNKSEIFAQVSIYVNGFTKPGRSQLHEMVVANGGRFVHYLSHKGQVTHIIASNLPLKKRTELKNYKVCKPDWIVDSLQAGRLLPWQEYALLSGEDETQSKLQGIVSCKHPDFLRQFFSKSRLHHLSRWKAELRAEFSEKFLEHPIRIPEKGRSTRIFHIDFDCFFASVAAMANGIDVNSEAIIVCHGVKNSDIASCNYEARRYGIKNGMWVSDAELLMPRTKRLIRLGYDFDKFEFVSKRFYQVLREFPVEFLVLPISIDEAVCVTDGDLSCGECELICQKLRENVWKSTNGCTVSVGCGRSLVMARLALKLGKPNGYLIASDEIDDTFWSRLRVCDLPGVGSSLASKINECGNQKIDNLLQLRQLKPDFLKNRLGEKMGNKVYLTVHGEDDEESRKMIYNPKEFFQRKSISIDINWGIRFDTISEIDQFIDRCTEYLVNKLGEFNKKTSQITLKVMKRSKNESIEPTKYLGGGRCDPFSRSTRLGIPTNEFGIIATEIKSSFRSLGCPPKELRGIAIQFNKLQHQQKECDSSQSKLPIFHNKIYQNLPNDVKGEIGHELKRRKITTFKNPKTMERINSYQEEFIRELPTQIGKEVKNEILINNKVNRRKVDEIKEQISNREFEKKNEKSHFLGNNTILLPIKFQNLTSFKKIIQLILKWVDDTIQSQGPHEKDLKLFEKYLQRLSDSDRLPLVLRICKLISIKLDLRSESFGHCNGFQEWEKVLLHMILPKLNKNKHTFQTVRKLDIDFDI